jgi:hypothetical protein
MGIPNNGAFSTAPTESAAPEAAEITENAEGTEELEAAEGELEAAAIEKKEEAVKKANKRKYKLKVDGKELEEEIDFDNEEDISKRLQLAKVAQKRMSEFSQLEKEVSQFIQELRKNPKKVLADPRIGLDVKRLAAEIIEEEISNSQKSPEQIERERIESELQALKEEREREKEDMRQRELERLQEQEFQRYDTMISKALEKSDLPKSPYVVKKIADYMLLGLNQGMDVTPDDVLPLVREEISEDLKQMFAVMPDEVIEAIVGKDVITRLRKKNIAKAKAGTPPQPLKAQIKETGQTAPKEAKTDKKVNYKDFFGI